MKKPGTTRILGGLSAAALLLALAFPAAVQAQGKGMTPPAETMDIGDEPGRVSTEEVTITEGPYARQMVFFRSNEAPGTVVIHSAERFLYVVQPNNRALRYGIGVGREGFQWSGLVQVSRKAEWPDWRPPPEMLQRQPYLPRFMAGGPGNPMGARALYLGSTVFRVHGTNQPETIGQSISSGCFRLANGDIIDLYSRVPLGTKVVVRHKATI
ncbi:MULTISPECIES: L,D-transpeptidase [Bosea]|jgi:lipoprotein-anchoring transpeptidase ErfK/SrfK|uniref:L,D-transpeptidase n=1 Tax=Bosea rubneri TaxID=3075434 RepID=A0ABU3S2P9_9HYPH|nr:MULTISPECIES: L,D-transpeptidase [unclassified Bosea (in: a-proteobacteria)]MDU0339073.1 L,D-transpeptidase [Bosea sp. ZW T0_25]HEV7338937.1 L,D-transpeptidase [Bosea sp. (in: a-proteobacteria)]